ncbi:MAG TPA: ABC transporter substrate-binding protein [Burkholderiaceae bacterium]|nr:ABC transporter substrate-binding protein [Burkholderiaceae bacterium]
MKRIAAIATGALLLIAPLGGLAQAPQKTAHIGILVGGSLAQRGHLEQALLRGLGEQGYVEGKNLVLERRYADGRGERVPEFARELAAMKLDAVITTCTPSTRAAQQALGSTPIVMAAVADPVGQHLIASLARPGAHTTGLSSQAEDIMPKMLELFASVLPRPATVAVLSDARSEVHPRMWRALVPVAQALNIKLLKVDVGSPFDVALPAAFEMAVREQAGAVFVLPDEPQFLSRRAEIVALAAKHRLPDFYGAREAVDEGGLMSYGENLRTTYHNAATYIKQVAQGANPGDIPVAQPIKFELVINLKTAKVLGLAIPQAMILRSDDVIR